MALSELEEAPWFSDLQHFGLAQLGVHLIRPPFDKRTTERNPVCLGFLILSAQTFDHLFIFGLADLSVHPEPLLPLARSAARHALRPGNRHVVLRLYSSGDAYRRAPLQWGQ